MTEKSVSYIKSQLHQPGDSAPSAVSKRQESAGSINMNVAKKRRICESVSPSVTVGVGYRSGGKNYQLQTPRRKKYGKILARSQNSSKSIAVELLKDDDGRKWVTNGIKNILKYELKQLCSKKVNSIQASKDPSVLSDFPWVKIVDEGLRYCPTLLSFLFECTKTKHEKPNRLYFIGTILCMLAKFRNSSMSLFQRLVSTLLYAEHTGTKTYDRLQKISISMSRKATTSIIDSLGSDFDSKVLQWKHDLIPPSSHHEIVGDDQRRFIENELLLCQSDIADDTSDTTSDIPVAIFPEQVPRDSSEWNDIHCNAENDDVCQSSNASTFSLRPPSFSDITEIDQSIDICCAEDEELSTNESTWNGFKLVGDNLDKNVRPRYRRVDHPTESLHFFQYYAVRDRVNLMDVPDLPNPSLHKHSSDIDLNVILPSTADHQVIFRNFGILVSRILVQDLSFFSMTFDGCETKHIDHCFSKEMAGKSDTVPLGVILKNENIVEEMIDILSDVHKYVPVRPLEVIDEKVHCSVAADKVHQLLLGGDQLTRKRVETAKECRKNSTTPTTQLTGVVPVCEDWHAKKVFLEVLKMYIYHACSWLCIM
jgi:L1 cell adhesion molecule like protein